MKKALRNSNVKPDKDSEIHHCKNGTKEELMDKWTEFSTDVKIGCKDGPSVAFILYSGDGFVN